MTSRYFTVAELIATAQTGFSAAQAAGAADPKIARALDALATTILDPMRERAGRPIFINSGYRCPALNRAIGGAPSSQHMRGEAADLTLRTTEGELWDLWRWVAFDSGLRFGQVIFEDNRPDDPTRGAWIHVSLGSPFRAAAQSGAVLTYTPAGGYRRVSADPGPRRG